MSHSHFNIFNNYEKLAGVWEHSYKEMQQLSINYNFWRRTRSAKVETLKPEFFCFQPNTLYNQA